MSIAIGKHCFNKRPSLTKRLMGFDFEGYKAEIQRLGRHYVDEQTRHEILTSDLEVRHRFSTNLIVDADNTSNTSDGAIDQERFRERYDIYGNNVILPGDAVYTTSRTS